MSKKLKINISDIRRLWPKPFPDYRWDTATQQLVTVLFDNTSGVYTYLCHRVAVSIFIWHLLEAIGVRAPFCIK